MLAPHLAPSDSLRRWAVMGGRCGQMQTLVLPQLVQRDSEASSGPCDDPWVSSLPSPGMRCTGHTCPQAERSAVRGWVHAAYHHHQRALPRLPRATQRCLPKQGGAGV